MKLAYLSGSVMAVALIVTSSTPTYARGGGHGGGHGGHGGHGHAHAFAHGGGHAHAHAFAHHAGHAHAFAHRTGFAGRHFAANRGFAYNRAGWNRGWGRGWGLGWGRGWRSGYWGGRYVGSYWPAYLAAGLVDPSYYYQYFNGVTTTRVPAPVATAQYDVTNVVQPIAPAAVPAGVGTTPCEDTAPPVAP